MRGETAVAIFDSIQAMISIHSPHARGDSSSCVVIVHQDYFNPLPSCEGRLGALDAEYNPIEFQSTPLMRGETLSTLVGIVSESNFNPLPSCEGRHSSDLQLTDSSDFNPLPSCEGRLSQARYYAHAEIFQSTPLMRGETCAEHVSNRATLISIHSPHARGDLAILATRLYPHPFQSTPLMRGETTKFLVFSSRHSISIHSPHARGDSINL